MSLGVWLVKEHEARFEIGGVWVTLGGGKDETRHVGSWSTIRSMWNFILNSCLRRTTGRSVSKSKIRQSQAAFSA